VRAIEHRNYVQHKAQHSPSIWFGSQEPPCIRPRIIYRERVTLNIVANGRRSMIGWKSALNSGGYSLSNDKNTVQRATTSSVKSTFYNTIHPQESCLTLPPQPLSNHSAQDKGSRLCCAPGCFDRGVRVVGKCLESKFKETAEKKIPFHEFDFEALEA
jgi:hypothetical protein